MGKTPKPLKILLLDPEMCEWEEFKALVAQGHTIKVAIASAGTIGSVAGYGDFDVILGPRAWYFTKGSRDFFQVMIDSVRARVYPRKDSE